MSKSKPAKVATVIMKKNGYTYAVPVQRVATKLMEGFTISNSEEEKYYNDQVERIQASVVVHNLGD